MNVLLLVSKVNGQFITRSVPRVLINEVETFYSNALRHILKEYDNVPEFAINLRDEIYEKEPTIKTLVMSAMSSETRHINYKLCAMWGLLLFKKISQILMTNIEWSSKKPVAIWRGSTTGDDDAWNNGYSRKELVLKSKQNPMYLDAGFTSIVQGRNDVSINDVVNQMDSITQMKYKYIIIPDGNVATYSYFWALATNSVIIKQKSHHKQYFEEYDDFKDCCIEIEKDFSDVIDVIKFLQQNDDYAKQIATNAYNFAKKHFNYDNFVKQLINIIIS